MKSLMIEVLDALFIMALCFSTLLFAMLLQGNTIAGIVYKIKTPSFLITVLSLVLYLGFVVIGSDKGLKTIIAHIYSGQTIKKGLEVGTI